jgi:hypothetical protein
MHTNVRNFSLYLVLLASVFLVYSFYLEDLILFGSFIFGLVLSLYYILRTYPLASRFQQNHMLAAISFGLMTVFSSGLLSIVILKSELPIAICRIIVIISFFSSPILNLVEVIRTRNSSSIHMEFAVMAFVNNSLVCDSSFNYSLVGLLWNHS